VTDTALTEPLFAYEGWYPIKTFAVNQLGNAPRLVVVPAQYTGDEQSGTERLFDSLTFQVTYAAAEIDDFTDPAIWEVKDQLSDTTAAFQVLAQDASGVARVLVTYTVDGTTWQSRALTYNSATGYWQGTVAGLISGKISYFVQAVDRAGNVNMSTNKGSLFEIERHDLYLPLVMR
jgi:hypothetical protein